MNIYFLDKSPWTAAQSLHDRHVKTAIQETAQILSNAWFTKWTNGLMSAEGHKASFGVAVDKKLSLHPLVRWVGLSTSNYEWAIKHLQALLVERKCRWPDSSPHPLQAFDWVLAGLEQQKDRRLAQIPCLFLSSFTPPPQLVSDECKMHEEQWVAAYRKYYRGYKLLYQDRGKSDGKIHFKNNVWTNRERPAWLS